MSKIIASIIVSIMTLMVWPAQAAKELYVIEFTPPGGNYNRMNLALSAQAAKRGYDIKEVRVNRCKGIENWRRANPNKPAIHAFDWLEDAARIVEPDNPASCDLELTKDRVITVNHVFNVHFCSMSKDKARSADSLFNNHNLKVGYVKTNAASEMGFTSTISMVNTKARQIPFKGAADQSQALLSGDIDIGIAQIPINFESIGATCFAQTNFNGIVDPGSIDLSKKFPSSIWSRYGSSQGYVGYNIDVNEFRAMALEASKTDERFLQQYKLGAAKKGVLAGESPEQQWTWIQNYINNFRKIVVEKK
jgi:hypothetical protein